MTIAPLETVFGEPPTIPDFLYHYTKAASFIEIVNSKCLWATDVLFVNDSTEYTYTLNLFTEEVDALSSTTPGKDEIRRILADAVPLAENVRPFITSFSKDGNDLSQWRSYCPEAGGVSLGISGARLQRLAEGQSFRLSRCEYRDFTQRTLVKEGIREALNGVSEILGGTSQEYIVRSLLAARLFELASTFKHPKFSKEDEWRLVSAADHRPADRLGFRSGLCGVTPYLRFSLTEMPDQNVVFERIFLGPTPYPTLAKFAVEEMAWSGKLGFSDVMYCDIPYRPANPR